MREILIQVWDGKEMTGGMPLPMFAGWLGAKYPNIGQNWVYRECTGLLDTTGQLIYAGDILLTYLNGKPVIGEMEWNQKKAQYGLNVEVDMDVPPHVEITVSSLDSAPRILGNVFHNPELLHHDNI